MHKYCRGQELKAAVASEGDDTPLHPQLPSQFQGYLVLSQKFPVDDDNGKTTRHDNHHRPTTDDDDNDKAMTTTTATIGNSDPAPEPRRGAHPDTVEERRGGVESRRDVVRKRGDVGGGSSM
jgi:hypothetical protein